MAGRIAGLLDRWHLRRARDYWARAAETVTGAEPFARRDLRVEARQMRRQIDRLLHLADHQPASPQPASPLSGAGRPRPALGTDWIWRPDVWCGPLSQPGAVVDAARKPVSDDITLHHDCPLGEIAFRQTRSLGAADRAPFALALDVFGFEGSFLSLVMTLPDAAVAGLSARHLVRVEARVDTPAPLPCFARLNLRHGPNVAELVSALPIGTSPAIAEFDLAYARIDQRRIERAWVDLIFNDAGMTRIILHDLVLSRRPRAEL